MDLDTLIKEIEIVPALGMQEKIALAQVLAIREQTAALRGATNELVDALSYVSR